MNQLEKADRRAASKKLSGQCTFPLPHEWHAHRQWTFRTWMLNAAPYHWRPSPDNDASWQRYAEPYFTNGAWLFQQDPQGVSEVVNDVEGVLQNFQRVMKSRQLRGEFDECVDTTDNDEQLLEWAGHALQKWYCRKANQSDAKAAAAFFILNRPQPKSKFGQTHLERYDRWLFDLAAFRERISGIEAARILHRRSS